MTGMNWNRIILGGLAAGAVMNFIDFLVNGLWLGASWQAEANALNSRLVDYTTSGMIGWIAFDFAAGILLVWLYAAIRPRFGPGPKTALLAGLMIWLITHIAFVSLAFTGLYSWSLVMMSTVGGILSALAGGYVGGMLYKEEGAVVAA